MPSTAEYAETITITNYNNSHGNIGDIKKILSRAFHESKPRTFLILYNEFQELEGALHRANIIFVTQHNKKLWHIGFNGMSWHLFELNSKEVQFPS